MAVEPLTAPSVGDPDGRRRVGLVLSAGGARAFAHVGALKVLHDRGVPIDLIVGVSMGSLVGAALAVGHSPSWMEQLIRDLRLDRVFRPRPSRTCLVDPTELRRVVHVLVGDRRFEDLELDLTIVATSLGQGRPVVIREGRVADAVLASSAIPLVFPPVPHLGDYLVDGAIVDGLPVEVAREHGADLVIAVDADNHERRPLRAPGLGRLAERMAARETTARRGPSRALILARALAHLARPHTPHAEADVVIEPRFGRIRARQFHRRERCIALGEAAARAAMPAIEQLLASTDDHFPGDDGSIPSHPRARASSRALEWGAEPLPGRVDPLA